MTENKNVLRVLNGYLGLSDLERREFLNEFNKYVQGGTYEKMISEGQIRLKADLGTTNNNKSCVCCGKG